MVDSIFYLGYLHLTYIPTTNPTNCNIKNINMELDFSYLFLCLVANIIGRGEEQWERNKGFVVLYNTYGLEGPKPSLSFALYIKIWSSLVESINFTPPILYTYTKCIILYVYKSWMIDHNNKIYNLNKKVLLSTTFHDYIHKNKVQKSLTCKYCVNIHDATVREIVLL
mgnify:CR=1 FL=1